MPRLLAHTRRTVPTSRGTRTAATLGALALLAAGCGGGDDVSESSTGTSTTGTTQPYTVEHVLGETTVESDPARVAALGFGDQDVLLALGIVPVVANQFVPEWTYGVGPWGEDLLDGAQPVPIDGNELSVETILAADPDLAVAVNLAMEQRVYDLLSQRVPVVAGPVGFDAYSIPWQEHTRAVGQAVDLGEEADELVAEVEAEVAQSAAEHPELGGRTAQVVTALPEVGNVRAYTSTARGYLLESLGLDIPAWVDEEAGDGFYVDLSAEEVGRLDADVIVFLGPEEDFEAEPLLAALPAAERGSVLFLDDDAGVAFAAPGPLTIPFALDALVPALEEAVAATD